jgi:AraC-like DNA-binding protein
MARLMPERAEARLEGSCGERARDWIRLAPGWRGVERIEARFSGQGYAPHRHDRYAIGITLMGVQSFRYRGAAEASLAGEMFVLHPDEQHDGSAGTEAGFRYRGLYLEPRLVQEAASETLLPLPFVAAPVSRDRRLAAALAPALADLARVPEALERDAIVAALAAALQALDPASAQRRLAPPAWRAVGAARDFLEAHLDRTVGSAELEQAAGLSRWELARQFRRCLGTSPYRYQLQRRLERARTLIRRGSGLAQAALAAGFADQAHLTRQFRSFYGMPPGRWAAIAAAGNIFSTENMG